MTIDEFIRRAEAQPIVSVDIEVRIPGPELQAFMNEGVHTIAEWNAHPDQRNEMRTFQHRHLLGPGLCDDEIDAWQAANPGYPLSAELRGLLGRIDGIHLWADLATSRAYFGALPLREWTPVGSSRWNQFLEIEQMPAAEKFVLSYHENGDYVLLYDTSVRAFAWHDLWEFAKPKITRSVEEFLEFWWRETAWLDPRTMQS